MYEKYGWHLISYGYEDEVLMDIYKLHKDMCREGIVMKSKNKSTPEKKIVVKKTPEPVKFNPLLLLVA